MKDFEPMAIAYDEDDNGFCVQIQDQLGNYPTVWLDVYNFTDDDYPTIDWNMWIFYKDRPYDMAVQKFQEDAIQDDGWIWCLLQECAINYLYEMGRIESIGNGYRRVE